jgi:hypothetical protein
LLVIVWAALGPGVLGVIAFGADVFRAGALGAAPGTGALALGADVLGAGAGALGAAVLGTGALALGADVLGAGAGALGAAVLGAGALALGADVVGAGAVGAVAVGVVEVCTGGGGATTCAPGMPSRGISPSTSRPCVVSAAGQARALHSSFAI